MRSLLCIEKESGCRLTDPGVSSERSASDSEERATRRNEMTKEKRKLIKTPREGPVGP